MAELQKTMMHGWIVIDKPGGLSSANVVGRVKYLTGALKAGHGGTLDPLATGVLPIALGEATKTTNYAMQGVKHYKFTVRWGEARNTDDSEGKVILTSSQRPACDEIRGVLPSFIGEISQIPPKFSAIKIAGKRAYKLARANEDIKIPPRQIKINNLKLLSSDLHTATFDIECGKGTYIRALARDLAVSLGTVGHISALRRTKVGAFTENMAISLDKLDSVVHSALLPEQMLSLETPLADIPALELGKSDAQRLRYGQAVTVTSEDVKTVRAKSDKRLVALAKIEMGKLQPLRVFNF